MFYLCENNNFFLETDLIHPGQVLKPSPEISDGKIGKNTQKFFLTLRSENKVFFCPPINKNHIFVEKVPEVVQ